MLKGLFKKPTKRRDIRFLDIESYKYQKSEKALKARQQQGDDFIQVQQDDARYSFEEHDTPSSDSFLDLIRQVTAKGDIFEEEKVTDEPLIAIESHAKCFLNSLGVFSDSKIYSALIQSVLSQYDLDVKHFNHPDTFTSNKYARFDAISSWIIFLSDEQDCDFLDNFLDRYVEKPTLFLFSKLNKDACMNRIAKFIKQNELEKFETVQTLNQANNELSQDNILLSLLPA